MKTTAKKGIVAIFDYQNPRPEGFNVPMPLRSESGDLYSFLLDLSVDGYGAKEIAIEAVANAQVWHRPLGHLHAQSPDILIKRGGTSITFKGDVLDFDIYAVGKDHQLTHPQTANEKVNRPFQLCYRNL